MNGKGKIGLAAMLSLLAAAGLAEPPPVIDVASRGIVADGTTCQSAALASLIREAPAGSELFFPKGVYFLSRCVEYSGKTNLAFRGEAGTVIKLHYSPTGETKESNNGFGAKGCRGLDWRGFMVTTDNPPGSAGRVVAKDLKAHTYDVRIDAAFPFTGEEHILGVDTCDEDGTPDYIIESWHKARRTEVPDGAGGTRTKITALEYEVLGDHLIRIPAPKWADLHWLPIGERVYFRYMIYGTTVFSFNDCADVRMRDIEIERCGSMGAVLGTGTADFTFERFNIRPPAGSPALIASGADGIHVLGLSGSLTLRDCHFKGLGDDALNVHAKSGEVKDYDPSTGAMRCIGRSRKREEIALPRGWARAGDELIVYDRETLLTKGRVRLAEYAEGGAARAESGEVAIRNGDFLANARDFPSVHVADCTVENTRARALVLQSHNMLVENCTFRGLSLPGVIISPDFRYWNEVGPTVNTEIRGCLFEKCGINKSRANLGALMVKTSHDATFTDEPAGVHRDIRVIGNTFRNCGNSGIFIQATRGVALKGNRFENCSSRRYDRTDDANLYDIRLRNCADVVMEGNETDKPAERLSQITSTGGKGEKDT